MSATDFADVARFIILLIVDSHSDYAAQRSAAPRRWYDMIMPLYAYVALVSLSGDDADADAAPRRTMSMSGYGLTDSLTHSQTHRQQLGA